MMALDDAQVPRLAPGCRLHVQDDGEAVLLVPEGALRLVGPGRAIVERIDGRSTVGEIVRALQQTFHGAEPETVRAQTIGFLDRLAGRGVVRTTAPREA